MDDLSTVPAASQEGNGRRDWRCFLVSLLRIPTETNRVVQVKYTNPVQILHGFEPIVLHPPHGSDRHRKVWVAGEERESMLLVQKVKAPLVTSWGAASDCCLIIALQVGG